MGAIAAKLRRRGEDDASADLRKRLARQQPSYLVGTSHSYDVKARKLDIEDTEERRQELDENEGYMMQQNTLLINAILSRHTWKALLILRNGPHMNIELRDYEYRTPLYAAAYIGDVRVVKKLLKLKADPGAFGPDGWAPLHAAVYNGNTPAVVALLKGKADPNLLTKKNSNSHVPSVGPLHMVASSPKLYFIDLTTRREMKQRARLRRAERLKQFRLHKANDVHKGALELLQAADYAKDQDKEELSLPKKSLFWKGAKRTLTFGKRAGGKHAAIYAPDEIEKAKNILFWSHFPNRIEMIVYNALRSSPHFRLEKRDSLGKTPLLWAAEFGNLCLVSRLLHDKANIESKDFDGYTALSHAVSQERYDCVECLIKVHADIAHRDVLWRTPMHLAALSGNRHVCEYLLSKKASINAVDSRGKTPTMLVMDKKDRALFAKVLREGPSLDHLDSRGWNVFMYAINADFFQELVPILNKLAADVPAKTFEEVLLWQDPQGYTVLHHAVQQKSLKFTKMILHLCSSAIVTKQDCNGHTPVHEACLAGDLEILVALVAEMQNVDEPTNNWGETGLMLSARRGHVECVLFLLNHTRLMVCADATRLDNSGKSFLMHVCIGGSLDLLNLLLVNREGNNRALGFCEVDVNMQDDHGATAVMICAREGNWQLVPSLVMARADLTVQDEDGFSALHWACMDNEVYGVLTLLDHGTEIDQRDKLGWSPIMHACSVGAHDVVRLLAERGSDLFLQSYSEETCFTIALNSKIREECTQILSDCVRQQLASTGLMETSTALSVTSGFFMISLLSAVDLCAGKTLPEDMNAYAYIQFKTHKNAEMMCVMSTCVLGTDKPSWHDSFRFDIDGPVDEHTFFSVHLFCAREDIYGDLSFTVVDDKLPQDPGARAAQPPKRKVDAYFDNQVNKVLQEKKKELKEAVQDAQTRALWSNVEARKWMELEMLQEKLPEVPLPPVPRHHMPLGFLVIPFRIIREAMSTGGVVSLRDRLMRGAVRGRVNIDLEFRPQMWRVHRPKPEQMMDPPDETALQDYELPKPLPPPRVPLVKPPPKMEGLVDMFHFSDEVANCEFDPVKDKPVLHGTPDLIRELKCVSLV